MPRSLGKTISLRTLNDTATLAGKIAATLKGGETIALVGELGAGKTTFTQLLAESLDVQQIVKSPSFTILQTYNASLKGRRITLCHVDAYRLHDIDELEALGFYDYTTDPNTVTVIEWADRIKKALPRDSTWIEFKLQEEKTNCLPLLSPLFSYAEYFFY